MTHYHINTLPRTNLGGDTNGRELFLSVDPAPTKAQYKQVTRHFGGCAEARQAEAKLDTVCDFPDIKESRNENDKF